jgi:hypothetical protein
MENVSLHAFVTISAKYLFVSTSRIILTKDSRIVYFGKKELNTMKLEHLKI